MPYLEDTESRSDITQEELWKIHDLEKNKGTEDKKDHKETKEVKRYGHYTSAFLEAKDPPDRVKIERAEDKERAGQLQTLYGEKPIYYQELIDVRVSERIKEKKVSKLSEADTRAIYEGMYRELCDNTNTEHDAFKKQYKTLLAELGKWAREHKVSAQMRRVTRPDVWTSFEDEVFLDIRVTSRMAPAIYGVMKLDFEKLLIRILYSDISLEKKKQVMSTLSQGFVNCTASKDSYLGEAVSALDPNPHFSWRKTQLALINKLIGRFLQRLIKDKLTKAKLAPWYSDIFDPHIKKYLFNLVVKKNKYPFSLQEYDDYFSSAKSEFAVEAKNRSNLERNIDNGLKRLPEQPHEFVDRCLIPEFIEHVMNALIPTLREEHGIEARVFYNEAKAKTSLADLPKTKKTRYTAIIDQKAGTIKAISSGKDVVFDQADLDALYKKCKGLEPSKLKKKLEQFFWEDYYSVQSGEKTELLEKYLLQFHENEDEIYNLIESILETEYLPEGLIRMHASNEFRNVRLLGPFIVWQLLQKGFLNKGVFFSEKTNPDYFELKIENNTSSLFGDGVDRKPGEKKPLTLVFISVREEVALYSANGKRVYDDFYDFFKDAERLKPGDVDFFLEAISKHKKLRQAFEVSPSKEARNWSEKMHYFSLKKIFESGVKSVKNRIDALPPKLYLLFNSMLISETKKSVSEARKKYLATVSDEFTRAVLIKARDDRFFRSLSVQVVCRNFRNEVKDVEGWIDALPPEFYASFHMILQGEEEKKPASDARKKYLTTVSDAFAQAVLMKAKKNYALIALLMKKERFTFSHIKALNDFVDFTILNSGQKEFKEKQSLYDLCASLIIDKSEKAEEKANPAEKEAACRGVLDQAKPAYYANMLRVFRNYDIRRGPFYKALCPSVMRTIFFEQVLEKLPRLVGGVLEDKIQGIAFDAVVKNAKLGMIALLERKIKQPQFSDKKNDRKIVTAQIALCRIAGESYFLLKKNNGNLKALLPSEKFQKYTSDTKAFLNGLKAKGAFKTLTKKEEAFFNHHFGRRDFHAWYLEAFYNDWKNDPKTLPFYKNKTLYFSDKSKTKRSALDSKENSLSHKADVDLIFDLLQKNNATVEHWESFCKFVDALSSHQDTAVDMKNVLASWRNCQFNTWTKNSISALTRTIKVKCAFVSRSRVEYPGTYNFRMFKGFLASQSEKLKLHVVSCDDVTISDETLNLINLGLFQLSERSKKTFAVDFYEAIANEDIYDIGHNVDSLMWAKKIVVNGEDKNSERRLETNLRLWLRYLEFFPGNKPSIENFKGLLYLSATEFGLHAVTIQKIFAMLEKINKESPGKVPQKVWRALRNFINVHDDPKEYDSIQQLISPYLPQTNEKLVSPVQSVISDRKVADSEVASMDFQDSIPPASYEASTQLSISSSLGNTTAESKPKILELFVEGVSLASSVSLGRYINLKNQADFLVFASPDNDDEREFIKLNIASFLTAFLKKIGNAPGFIQSQVFIPLMLERFLSREVGCSSFIVRENLWELTKNLLENNTVFSGNVAKACIDLLVKSFDDDAKTYLKTWTQEEYLLFIFGYAVSKGYYNLACFLLEEVIPGDCFLGKKDEDYPIGGYRLGGLFEKAISDNEFYLGRQILLLQGYVTPDNRNKLLEIMSLGNRERRSLERSTIPEKLLRYFPEALLYPQLPPPHGDRWIPSPCSPEMLGLIIEQLPWVDTQCLSIYLKSHLILHAKKSSFLSTFSPYGYNEFLLHADKVSKQFCESKSIWLRFKIAMMWFFELTAIARMLEDVTDPYASGWKRFGAGIATVFLGVTWLFMLPLILAKNLLKLVLEYPLANMDAAMWDFTTSVLNLDGLSICWKLFPLIAFFIVRIIKKCIQFVLSPLKQIHHYYHRYGKMGLVLSTLFAIAVWGALLMFVLPLVTPVLAMASPLFLLTLIPGFKATILGALSAFFSKINFLSGPSTGLMAVHGNAAAVSTCLQTGAVPILATHSILHKAAEQRVPKAPHVKLFKFKGSSTLKNESKHFASSNQSGLRARLLGGGESKSSDEHIAPLSLIDFNNGVEEKKPASLPYEPLEIENSNSPRSIRSFCRIS